MHMQRAFTGLRATILLSLLAAAIGQVAAQDDSDQAQPKQRRVSVVHVHLGDNCAGYLYITEEGLRYKVLAPENHKNHSFQIRRDEITALQPWVFMGQQQNITEIKTAHATYQFWVLPKGTDPVAARSQNMNAVAAPAAKLIEAIRDPFGGAQPTAAKSSPGTGSSDGNGDGASSAQHRAPSSQASSSPSDSDIQATHKLPAGALEGVYVGFGLEYSHMGHHEYYFTSDGWVINNIPYVNMDNFDMNVYRNDPSHKLFFGRYRVEGNKINIVWANNADRRDVIKLSETSAEPGIDTYIPTCRCTGKKLSGKFHWSSPTDERYVQFFPDGRFLDHGLTDQVVGDNPHGYAGITDPPRNFRGTYSIRNQKLTFNFSDGKQATVAFIAPKALEQAPSFGWMGVGHDSGVKGAEYVVLLVLYEEHYQVQP
jgi:hypothetical protein